MNEEPYAQAQAPLIQAYPIWRVQDVLLISFASVALLLGGTLIFGRLSSIQGSPLDRSSLVFTALMAALEAIVLVACVALLGMKRRGVTWGEIGVRGVSSQWIWAAVAVALIFIPLMGLIALVIQVILRQPVNNPQLEFLVPKNFSWLGALAMLVFGGLAVPFAEELFFRGVFYRWLRDRWGFWPAILLSSLVFGLLHGEISIAGATFVMGLALAWFYERSGSLWPSVLVHVLNNSLKLALLYAVVASGITIPGIQ